MYWENWVTLIGGVVFVGIGILIVRFRVAIARANAAAQSRISPRFGREQEKRATPFWAGIVGVVFWIVGAGFILMGVFRHHW